MPGHRRAQPFRNHQPRRRARAEAEVFIPESPEAAALRREAAICWSAATGLPAASWLGGMEPNTAPLIEAVRRFLAAGASVGPAVGRWHVLTRADGVRLVVATDVLAEAVETRR
jgi:hypothetical protein